MVAAKPASNDVQVSAISLGLAPANVCFPTIADTHPAATLSAGAEPMQLEFMSDVAVADAELYLYLDEAGLSRLLGAVEAARRSGHDHLMTEQWGGTGLTATDGSTRTFNKVTVTFQS